MYEDIKRYFYCKMSRIRALKNEVLFLKAELLKQEKKNRNLALKVGELMVNSDAITQGYNELENRFNELEASYERLDVHAKEGWDMAERLMTRIEQQEIEQFGELLWPEDVYGDDPNNSELSTSAGEEGSEEEES